MGRGLSKVSLLFIALLDGLLINLGIITAFAFRFGFPLPRYNFAPYMSLAPWLFLISLMIFYMFDLYADWRRKSLYNLIYSVVLAVLTLTLSTMALTFWYRGFSFPRSVLVTTPFIQVLFAGLFRGGIWFFDKKLFGRKRVLIIGRDSTDCRNIAEKFLEHDDGWFVVQDYITVHESKKLEGKLQNIDVVLLGSSLQDKMNIVNCCVRNGKEILVVPDVFELYVLGSVVQQVDDMLVLSIQPPKLSPSQVLFKRLFDITFSLSMLLLLGPVMIILAIIVRLTSAGPVLFKQERLGLNEKPYDVLKFRSMVMDAEKLTGPVLATDKDPRITSIGRFLRALRLDELPQLFNVLKGEMSIVGPRPERPFFVKKFQNEIPYYTSRLSVKPGITGLAQVMAKYSTTVEDKLRFDLMYVRNYSLALDIKIILQTIRVVLQREQAGGVKQHSTQNENLTRLFG